jgi:hypothetical protein
MLVLESDADDAHHVVRTAGVERVHRRGAAPTLLRDALDVARPRAAHQP